MKFPEKYRNNSHPNRNYHTKPGDEYGIFLIPSYFGFFHCMASQQGGWEHVSISCKTKKMKELQRCPTWEEMCLIKELFWGDDHTVVQYHPKKEDYVNRHPHTLHLWRPIEKELPTPPKIFV